MEKLKYITTVDELRKYIGKVVLLYYTTDRKIDGKIQYAWAKKLTRVEKSKYRNENDNSIIHLDVFGTDEVVFEDINLQNRPVEKQHVPRFEHHNEKHSNAQRYIRELTITEKLMYRILVKKEERKRKEYNKYEEQ